MAATRSGRPPLEVTPPELLPKLGDFPAVTTSFSRKAVLLPPHSADPLLDPEPISTPLDLDAVSDDDPGVDIPVQGIILTHAQTWTRRGLALGHLLHSLCLAPGEATRVAVQDWTHRQRGTGEESTRQDDRSATDETQNRALQEVQDAVARESQHGQSSMAADSNTEQAGFSLFGFSASVGHSGSIATTATSSAGSRDLGVKENQDVHLAAQQHAEAARTRRASVVREVTESDTQTVTTRIVANYNRAHALTVQYFEVVEVYQVETRVVRAQPCLFVPMALKDGAWLLSRYPSVVADAAQAAGMDQLASTIRSLTSAGAALRAQAGDVEDLSARAKDTLGQIETAVTSMGDSGQQVSLTGQHMVPRIFPPPPVEPPTQAEIQEMWRLGRVIRDQAQNTQALLAAAREALNGIAQAARKVDADEQVQRAQIAQRLNEHREYFNQAVWLRALTPRVVHLLLKDRIYGADLLNDVLDPTPVAIVGNLVAFPIASGLFLPSGEPPPRIRGDQFLRSNVALPTGGLFAEAVLGQGVSAERLDMTRFWDWKDSPIPLVPPELQAVGMAHGTTPMDLTSGKLDETSAPIRALASLPDPAGIAELLTTLRQSNMFRDMSGIDAAKEVAIETAKNATGAAADAAKNATQSFQDFAQFTERMSQMAMTSGSSALGALSNMTGEGGMPSLPGMGGSGASPGGTGKAGGEGDAGAAEGGAEGAAEGGAEAGAGGAAGSAGGLGSILGDAAELLPLALLADRQMATPDPAEPGAPPARAARQGRQSRKEQR